ncbi:MAG: IPT/TIG domain-containing protein [Clostridia bacterium]|nr:IPT/TIG domain-containing protein [Clostridia bacterium]
MSDDQITNEIAIKELLRVAASLPAYREFYNNAVLNRYDNSENLFEIAAGSGRDRYYIINNNYWGTTNDKLIDQIVTDNNDYTSLGHIVTDPILTLDSPELETIYPFVTEIYLTDTEGNRVTSVGYGQDVTVHVKFNRDMDTTVQPMVSYGPAEPYTDYVLDGEFVSPREWVADFAVKGVIDAGSEYFRVKDAVAADDAWLKTGTDAARFAFEVSRTGAEAMVLQATGGENKIELFWMQDDYDTLAGFNVYRSTSADGSFVKINTRLIPGTIREYVDTDVEPGKEYFYYFTVMGTDLVESIPSNIASAMPIDNVKPTVTHTRVTYGNAGEALSFTVTASDNIGVTYVKIFYRVQGSDTYSALTLSNTEGNKYYGVITASQVTAEGLEYYLEVSDGTSVVRDGSASTPIKVYIDNSLAIYSVTPFKVYTDEVAKGITATLTGVNFTDTMTLTVGGKAVDYTYLSSTQISFTLPTGNHGRCDVVLTDGARSADLNNAITYADRNSEAQITSPGEAKAREAIKLPIKLTAEGDIISAMLQLKLDKSLYSSIKFEKAATLGSAYATFNTTSAGVVKIAISSTTPIDLSEPVGYLVLTPNNTVEPIATSIEMTSATVNAIPVETLVDCALDIKPNFTFSGKITYYQGGAPIAGVRVTLNNGMTAYTDENGVYTFTGITTNHIVITVSHSGYVNNAITAMDASAILGDVVAESSSFTELQMIAADVDGDGMVTPHDAAYILQKNVGIIEGSFPGSGEEWTFVGSTVLYLTADRSDVNFTGILLGDVTGDWTDTPVEEMD